MNLTQFFITLCMTAVSFMIYEFLINGLKRFRKPIFINSTWIKVQDQPVPKNKYDDDVYFDLILTDGIKVDNCASSSLRYNEKGEVVIGYNMRVVTHWQYMPSPPKK